MRHWMIAAAAWAFLTPAAAFAQAVAPPDPIAGSAAAKRWCSECHVVASAQAGVAVDGAPTWMSIAHDPATSPAGLRQFLLSPHRGMPRLDLSRQDIDEIVAYIMTLRP